MVPFLPAEKACAQRLQAQRQEASLYFIENKGQVTDQHYRPRPDIDFRITAGNGLSIFIGSGKIHYQWNTPLATLHPDNTDPSFRPEWSAAERSNLLSFEGIPDNKQVAMCRMDVTLVGTDPHAKVIAEQKQSFYERYYTPQFGEQGATAYAYQKITYQNVYPNIDWVLYVKGDKVEYDFIVHPGGKESDIQLKYDGTSDLAINENGSLTATTPSGSVTEAAPVSYQKADGKSVTSFFTLKNNVVSFTTGDYLGTLVIDPTLNWSTYYGGTDDDQSRNNSLSGDNNGNVYFDGYTQSTANIATIGSYKDTLTGNYDAFLVKLNAAGVRQWATYYGGTGNEYVYGTVCDQLGKVYIGGYTNSSAGIATTGAYQTVIGTTGSGTDAFLIQFDTSGNRIWGTYYGGSSTENALGFACDRDGNVFVTGYTGSTANIATTGAYQTVRASSADCFLAKFNSLGILKWATYYGGPGSEKAQAVSCDTAKNVYIVGFTQSTSGMTSTGAHQTTFGGGQDAFLVKFDSAGSRLWATYYGGSGDDQGFGIACDDACQTYITGYTLSSSGMATTGAHQTVFGGGLAVADAFLAKFDYSGNLKWSTYYGGTSSDVSHAVTCDHLGNIYIAGGTGSDTGIATVGTFKDTLDMGDGFIAKFDTSGVRHWGTYFGGEAEDGFSSIYYNHLSKLFLSGMTNSNTNLSTTGSHQTTFGGGSWDVFLAKFDDCQLVAPSSITGIDTVCRGSSHTYSVPLVSGATSYLWTLPAGWTGTSTSNTITVTTGTTSDTIKVSANFACGASAQAKLPVTINPLPTIMPSGTLQHCNGDSTTLTASSGISYQWLAGGAVVPGAIADTYIVHAPGTYAVIATSLNGCVDTSIADTLIVHPLPTPVITAAGTILSTGSYVTYQWNRNGTPITGATNATFTLMVMSGDYTVTVTDSNGCAGSSSPYNPSVGIHAIRKGDRIVKIYPNPASGVVHIAAGTPVHISISSLEGRLISGYDSAGDIDIRALSSGVYVLRVYDEQGILLATEKLIKSATR